MAADMAAAFLFDRLLKRRQIARAKPDFSRHSALFDDAAAQLVARLGEVKRTFEDAVDLSPFPFLERQGLAAVSCGDAACDEECLPFAAERFDLAVSNMGLHWANDLPRALTEILRVLKPGGLFLAALLGENSLRELRACLLEAETEVMGGVSPRISPMISLRDAGALLGQAGFRLPVADVEPVTLLYKDIFTLMRDLRGMGQTNALTERLRTPTRRSVFDLADRLYRAYFGDAQGRVPATFDVIYLHGWKPF